jgi:hypothetical protein
VAGSLTKSPGFVVARLLVDLGLGSLYNANLTWPVYVGVEPNVPDEVVTVFDTAGRMLGSLMTGQQQEMHGVQVRVRARTQEAGYTKCRQIAVGLDAVTLRTITIGGTTYLINNFNRTTDVIFLGQQKPESTRYIHVVNLLAHVRQTA